MIISAVHDKIVPHLHNMPEESGPTSAYDYMQYQVTCIYIYLASIDSACVTSYILPCFEEVIWFSPVYVPPRHASRRL